MSWFTLYLASGTAFFGGSAALAAALGLLLVRRRWARVVAWLAAIAGVTLILLSATPLPWWGYAGWLGAAAAAFVVSTRQPRGRTSVVMILQAVAFTAAAAGLEARHRRMPTVEPVLQRRFYVIGDSLSAGVDVDGGYTWAEIIRREREVAVRNMSFGGATVASTLSTMHRYPPLGDGLYLVEIGGNDQFGHTPVPEFEADLDELLRRVAGPGRTVVMFELPLLPLNNGYGHAQRRLARKYDVKLIPKQFLIDVVAPHGATTDGVHLTAAGHRAMAEKVWAVIGPALPAR